MKTAFKILSPQKKLVLASMALGLMLAAAGCGKQAYTVTPTAQEQDAPGSFMIPAKVDILLVEDDTGSVREAFSQISAEMNDFLTSLTGRGWDYHFATMPLTTFRAVSQVQASKYDINWGSQWTSPDPSITDPSLLENVTSSAFRFPTYQQGSPYYSDFLTGDNVTTAQNGSEPGFANMIKTLTGRDPITGASVDGGMRSTGFMRPDALLVVVMVGNGNDTSEVNICTRNDGYVGPCEQAGYPYNIPCGQSGAVAAPHCASAAQSFSKYQGLFQGVKTDSRMLKFYALVAGAAYPSGGCMGTNSYQGIRYQQMASSLGGTSYDICTTPVSTLLGDLEGSLQAVKQNFRTRYLFIPQDADPASIVVTRHSGGVDSTIPSGATNGWTYAGHLSNVYTIDYPVSMNLASGYAIELHGSAKLQGAETATVSFKPAGAQDSVSK